MKEIEVLDWGYVKLVESFGDELTIVNAARVSFDKQSTNLNDKDMKLLHYLKKHNHMSPFRQVMYRFEIKAPKFVMLHIYKHMVGVEACSSSRELHSFNEVSGRYTDLSDFDIYYPEEFRSQSKDNKQASDGTCENSEYAKEIYDNTIFLLKSNYELLLKLGVAKEQARMILPQSIFTKCVFTCSLQALINLIHLRDDNSSQHETQLYAQAMKDLFKFNNPILFDIFFTQES
jgi:thymidylate synthase (FAD)